MKANALATANQAPVGMMNLMDLGAAESMLQQVQAERVMLLQRLQLLHGKCPNFEEKAGAKCRVTLQNC
eukprot:symbB.v1.2.039785.t1/scaffold6784.1/size15560/2